GSIVYAAGDFETIGGQPRRFLAALDARTGLATNWNPGPAFGVACLAVQGAAVYAGGFYANYGLEGIFGFAAFPSAHAANVKLVPPADLESGLRTPSLAF